MGQARTSATASPKSQNPDSLMVTGLPGDQWEIIWNYLEKAGAKSTNAEAVLIELAWSSVAALALAALRTF